MRTQQKTISHAQMRDLLKRENTLNGGILYHCGPVVIKDDQGNWKCVAAGPTGSSRGLAPAARHQC